MKNKRGWKDEVRTEKSERRGDEGKGKQESFKATLLRRPRITKT